MIERVVWRNLQPHARIEVEFAAGLTAIVGETDAGKTAIIRGLRWICLGGPPGGLMRRGAKSITGVLSVDGRDITRRRTGSVNSYQIDADEPYRAVSQSVPDDVRSILMVGEDNFQMQFDAPFWLGLGASEVARRLNRVVALDLIDRAVSSLSVGSHRARQAAARAEDRLQAARDRLASLDWADAAAAALESLESLEEDVRSRQRKIDRLGEAVEAAGESGGRAAEARDVADRAARELSGDITLTACRLMEITEEIKSLEPVVDNLERAEGRRCKLQKDLSQAEMRLAELRRRGCPLCGGDLGG